MKAILTCPDTGKTLTYLFRTPTEQEIIDHADKPAYCNYCRTITDTCEYDCEVCGLSKPHPDVVACN